MKSLLTLALLYGFACGAYVPVRKFLDVLNEKPVIGIITQPSLFKDYPSANYSYIAASYVKFVESAGARVVPIPYETTTAQLDKYFEGLNGLLIPGGDADLDTPAGPSQFVKSVAYLVNKAIKASKLGDTFPVYAVCLGHQALHYIVSGYKTPFLIRVYDEESVNHFLEQVDRSATLYKDLSDSLFKNMTKDPVIFYNHHFGVSPTFYASNPSVDSFFEITATNKDSKGQVFVASAEARNYPIYTVQYHPEKAVYEWKVPADHSDEAVLISQNHGDAFMEVARHSQHQFSTNVLKNIVIYNYKAILSPLDSFVQAYVFKNGELKID